MNMNASSDVDVDIGEVCGVSRDNLAPTEAKDQVGLSRVPHQVKAWKLDEVRGDARSIDLVHKSVLLPSLPNPSSFYLIVEIHILFTPISPN